MCGVINHVSNFDFSSQTQKVYEWTIKFHIHYKLQFCGLFYVAAFLRHAGELYKWSGVLMQPGGWPYSPVALNKDVCYKFPLILASLRLEMPITLLNVCISFPLLLLFFKITVFPASGSHHPPILELFWSFYAITIWN